MSLFQWDPALETGYVDIDEQHKEIVRLAGRLDETARTHAPSLTLVEEAVYELSEYVVDHFADEERLMAEFKYPALEYHKGFHRKMQADTLHLATCYFKGGDFISIEEIAPLVVNWLRSHVLEEDMKYIAYIAERGCPVDRPDSSV